MNNANPRTLEERRILADGCALRRFLDLFCNRWSSLTLQLDCLRDRKPKDAAAVFVKAVREGWAPPSKYFGRIEAAERAQKAKH